MTQRHMYELSSSECQELLESTRIGRLVYADERGPIAVPVNYGMEGSNIVMRVGGGAKVAAMAQQTLAFEIDSIANEEHAGWSVIVRGSGQELDLEDVPEILHHMEGHFPRPWAAGLHNIWLRITPDTVTGRRLGEIDEAAPTN